MPQKYCNQIQELLNKESPLNKNLSVLDIDVLRYLISKALMQGNPPSNAIVAKWLMAGIFHGNNPEFLEPLKISNSSYLLSRVNLITSQ